MKKINLFATEIRPGLPFHRFNSKTVNSLWQGWLNSTASMLSIILMSWCNIGLAQYIFVPQPTILAPAAKVPIVPSPPNQNLLSGNLPPLVIQKLSEFKIPLSSYGLYIQKIDQPNPYYAWQSLRSFNPASTMKIVTTVTALNYLGPTFRWPTHFYTDRPIKGGVLLGNLYIKGTGDPKLIPESFENIVARFKSKNIREINGKIILDKQLYHSSVYKSKLIDGEERRAYNVRPDPLLFAFNSLQLQLSIQDKQPLITIKPDLADLAINNQLSLVKGPCLANWIDALQILPNPLINGSMAILVKGDYPIACGTSTFHAAVLNNDWMFWSGFKFAWEKFGGVMHNGITQGKLPPKARLIMTHYSLPLQEIIKDINKYSNNVMARQLFLTLGSQRLQQTTQLASSQQMVRQWLKQIGIPQGLLSNFHIENGSGLSRKERISPKMMADILLKARQFKTNHLFIDSLPIVGVDGTTRRQLQKSPARGHAFIKTGTLDNVSSIAGYVTNAKGETFVVVSFINHPFASQATSVHYDLIDWLFQQ